MKIRKLTISLLSVFLLAGCGGGEPTPTTAPAPTSSNPTTTTPVAREIDIGSSNYRANLEAAKNLFFTYDSSRKTLSATYYDDLYHMVRVQVNSEKSFGGPVSFVYYEGVYFNSMMKFTNGNTDYYFYYTARNGNVESKQYLMLRVQQGDVYTEAQLYQPGDPTFKLGAIGTTLTGNYYISSDKVNITLSNGSVVQAYLRAHYNDECKMKLEYSSTATFEEATLLEDYVGFTSLYPSLVRADNGLEILDHSKGTMSKPDLVTIRKKAKGSSYTVFEEIVLSQVL